MNEKMKHFDLLGHKCSDAVTGFEGVADSISFDLYGCIQIALMPPVDMGKPGEYPSGRWFDAKRLKKISDEPVIAPPDFSQPEIGPADKPIQSNEYVR